MFCAHLVLTAVFLFQLKHTWPFCTDSDPRQVCLPGEWLDWGGCEGTCNKQVRIRKRAICCDKHHTDLESCFRACKLNASADTDTRPCRRCQHGVNINDLHCRCDKAYAGACCENDDRDTTVIKFKQRTSQSSPLLTKRGFIKSRRWTSMDAKSIFTTLAMSAIKHTDGIRTKPMKIQASVNSSQTFLSRARQRSVNKYMVTSNEQSLRPTTRPASSNNEQAKETTAVTTFWLPLCATAASLAVIICMGSLIWKRKKRRIKGIKRKTTGEHCSRSQNDLSLY